MGILNGDYDWVIKWGFYIGILNGEFKWGILMGTLKGGFGWRF